MNREILENSDIVFIKKSINNKYEELKSKNRTIEDTISDKSHPWDKPLFNSINVKYHETCMKFVRYDENDPNDICDVFNSIGALLMLFDLILLDIQNMKSEKK